MPLPRLLLQQVLEVFQETCRGYGAAAWRGVQHRPTDCDWVLFSSADGSDRLSVEELPK